MNLAALWKLPVVFMVTNNRFGMGTLLERHSAVTDLQVKGEGFGVPGMECDGMDVLDTYNVTKEALRRARRAAPARPGGGAHLPLPRPLDGRPRGVPLKGGGRAVARARPDRGVRRPAGGRERPHRTGSARTSTRPPSRSSTPPWPTPNASPHPAPELLYDDVYVFGGQINGWYSLDERSPEPHRGEDERRLAQEAGPAQEAR